MRSSSTSSGGHREQHLGSAAFTAAAPPSQNDDVDQAEDVMHRLSRGNNNTYTTANNTNDMYKLFLSFAIIFIAVHQLLVHPLLLMTQTTSQDHNHHSQALSKTCVEATESNIFHCTDTPTRIHRNDGNNDNKHGQSNDEQSGEEISQNNNKNKSKYRGVSQYISGSNEEMMKMAEVLHLMEEYWKKWMVNSASIMEEFEEINFLNICTNRHERCVFWASVGECEKNPTYMDSDCTLACRVCEKFLDPSDSTTTTTDEL